MKKLQTYRTDEITVTFDPNRCIHSAVCLQALPAVFDVRRSRWVAPEAAEPAQVAAAVDRCPSGALQVALRPAAVTIEDNPEVDLDTSIRASRNGPLLVQGDFKLLDEDGAPIDGAARIALCRCGGTGNQPFCDGTHARIGFRSKRASET